MSGTTTFSPPYLLFLPPLYEVKKVLSMPISIFLATKQGKKDFVFRACEEHKVLFFPCFVARCIFFAQFQLFHYDLPFGFSAKTLFA